MAYEKECDIVLQTLSTTMQKYHLAAVNSYLVADGFKLSPNDLLAIMAILKVNDHIELIKESGLFAAHIDKSTMEVTFYGIVGITQKGLAFISNSSYLSEKNNADLVNNKLRYDHNNAKRIYSTYWWTFGFALCGLIISIVLAILKIVEKH